MCIRDRNVYGTMDGATPQAFPSTLSFNTSGALTTAMPLVLPSWALTTGAASPWSPGSMDFTGTTQYGSASSVDALTQGGYASGSLTGLSVGSDGIVQGRYSKDVYKRQYQTNAEVMNTAKQLLLKTLTLGQ